MEAISRGEIDGLSSNDIALLNPSVSIERCSEEFCRLLRKQDLRIAAISTTTAGCIEARKMAQIIKDAFENVVIIFGGPHEDDLEDINKTAFHPEFSNFVDFSVAGDGEYVLLALVKLIFEYSGFSTKRIKERILENKKLIEGLPGVGGMFFKLEDECISLKYHSFLNLDKISLIPRELIDEMDTKSFSVFMRRGHAVKTAQVMTERGCPWNCTFCSESTKAVKGDIAAVRAAEAVRKNIRSIDHVMAEIERVLSFESFVMQRYGIVRENYQAVFFDDSTFTHTFGQRRDYLNQLLANLHILRRRYEFEWGCQTRVDQLDKDILDAMMDAGCTYIYVGLESVNDKLLKQMAKGMNKEKIKEAFNLVADVNTRHSGILRVGLSLVFGVPNLNTDETEENQDTALETIEFVEQLTRLDLVNVVSPNISVYYPGTLISKFSSRSLDFHYSYGEVPYPNYPWNRFEDGTGYHAKNLTEELARFIIEESIERLGEVLVDQDLYNVDEIQSQYWESDFNTKHANLNHASIMKPSEDVHRYAFNVSEYNKQDTCEVTRQKVSVAFGAENPALVAFARNTTEACSLALWLAALHAQEKVQKVMVTDVENYSVRRALKFYADHANLSGRYRWASYPTFGSEVYSGQISGTIPRSTEIIVTKILRDIIEGNPEKCIIDAVRQERPDFLVVSHVERSTGRILDVKYLSEVLKKEFPSLYILIDGAKAFGAIPKVNVGDLAADFYVAGPHFTVGSYPVGVLWFAEHILDDLRAVKISLPKPYLLPILKSMFSKDTLIGSNTEETFCLQDVRSLLKAIECLEEQRLLTANDFSALDTVRRSLKELFQSLLCKLVPDSMIMSPVGPRFTNYILSFRLDGWDMRSIAENL
ncbi:aminotransferase class V-fold PLP-dependent enzyme, partial [Nitrosomonas nitrosa]|uniref:aminotransferase class V-fold PLP-dependent enzyme n=1 Tax=Nitrosomonas nitrosa TaxID=52442 RepID=UPI0023F66027